jgi:hypothetical protein
VEICKFANFHIVPTAQRDKNLVPIGTMSVLIASTGAWRQQTVPIDTVLQPKISLEQAAEQRAVIAAKLANMKRTDTLKQCRSDVPIGTSEIGLEQAAERRP